MFGMIDFIFPPIFLRCIIRLVYPACDGIASTAGGGAACDIEVG